MDILSAPLRIGFISGNFPPTEFTLILSKTFDIDASSQILFPDIMVTQKYNRTVSLQSADDFQFEITSLTCDNNSFVVSHKSGVAKQHWVEISFVPQLAGEQKGFIGI
ncbi:MAG: hypothetical protein LBU65_03350 [Planctomycetaceae bacterium]|jgi:hypothetical protein|nr:hypothetical protein [Planctomycetaceae bacterium]